MRTVEPVAATAAASMVRCRDVSVAVDGALLLDRVSIDVAPDEWVCILGPNGAGKTTLLRAIAGLVPYDGAIDIEGTSARALTARRRAQRIALVPQIPVIPPGLRVIDYVLLGRTPHISLLASEGAGDVDRAHHALELLALHALAGRRIESLSGGERQRVVIARAIAQETPVVLLDEPTAALDIGHQQDVLELVDELRRRHRFTVVSTMHDLTLAGLYADRLVLLRDGAVVHEGRGEDVLTEELLARYFGARVHVIDGPHGRVVVPHRHRPHAANEESP
jgi:iron complex transport system ATP-binding protein